MSTVGLPLSKLPGMVQPVRELVASSVTNPVSVSALLHMQYYNFELLLNYSTTTLHPFDGLFSRINLRKSQYQKSKTRWWGFWDAVASAGPYADNLHLAPAENHTNTSSLNFYMADALPDTQPTVSKHWRQVFNYCNKTKIQTSLTMTLRHPIWGLIITDFCFLAPVGNRLSKTWLSW